MLEIITAIAALIPTLIKEFDPNVSASAFNLANALIASIAGLITSWKTGSESITNSVLTTLQAMLAAFESDPQVNLGGLNDISEAIADLKAAIVAYQAAMVTTDPSTLQPIDPLA